MNESHDFDLIRALVEGRLAPEDALRLEGRLAADPELAAFRDEYAFVHGATAGLEALGPSTRLHFGAVAPPAPSSVIAWPRWGRAAAAALLISAAALGGYSYLAPAVPDSVMLQSIPLHVTADAASLPEIPEGLADYRPARGGSIAWIDSLEEGRALGRLSGRPVLVFSEYPGCPLCAEMDRTTFRDEDVLARIGDVIPVKVNLANVTPEELKFYWARYPYFGVQDVDGKEIHAFPGAQTGESLTQGIEMAAELAEVAGPVAGPKVSWELMSLWGGRFEAALDAETSREFGRADELYRAFEVAEVPAALRRAADDARKRIAAAAGRALDEARRLSETDLALAEASLSESRLQFAGSVHAQDLAETDRVLRINGRFPRLLQETR